MFMKSALVITVIVLLAAIPANAGDALEEIKAQCAAEWPGDFRMQRYCQEQQLEGAIQMIAFMQKTGISNMNAKEWEAKAKAGDPYAQMGAKCMGEWMTDTATDYRMIAYCLKQQLEAWQAMSGKGSDVLQAMEDAKAH